MKVKIYKLVDPRDSSVFYVGKTIKRLCDRLAMHMHCSRHRNTKRDKWIRENLTPLNIKPKIELIEDIDETVWREKEIYWVKEYRK